MSIICVWELLELRPSPSPGADTPTAGVNIFEPQIALQAALGKPQLAPPLLLGFLSRFLAVALILGP